KQGLALDNTKRAADKYKESLLDLTSAQRAYVAEANKVVRQTAISATPVSYINAEGDKAGRDPFDATKVRNVVKPTGMFNYATGAVYSGLSVSEKLNQEEAKAQAALRAMLNKRNNELKRYNEEQKALEEQRLADFNLVETKLKEASARRVKIEQDREKAIQANLQASINKQREINAAYVAQSVKSLTTPDEAGRASELASLRSFIQAKYERLAEEEKAQEDLRRKTIASNLAAYKQQTSDAVNELNNRVNLEASIRRFGADSQQTIAVKAAIEEQRIRKELATNIASIEKDIASGSITNAEARSKTRTATTLATTALIENSKALDENNKVVDRSKQQHKSLLTHITEVYGAYQLLNTGLGLIKQGLLGIPQAGIALEQATASLSAVLGSQGATTTLKDLRILADSAGQSFTALAEAYTRFAPSAMLAGAQQEEVNQVFEDFTKASTVLHLTTSEVKSLYLALEQMYAKSTVQSEEIKKQLGNVLPGAVEVGAKAMNMNVAEFMKAMSKNLIAAKDFVPKFAEAYRKMFGGVDDSVFNDARTKLLSNLQRIKNEYFYISADL
ncbi:tape measure protein, partial [Candidatus Woesearchaeota archaeon]|nr:tape measure protein [Candidatus Woesearchaeota archaeon]